MTTDMSERSRFKTQVMEIGNKISCLEEEIADGTSVTEALYKTTLRIPTTQAALRMQTATGKINTPPKAKSRAARSAGRRAVIRGRTSLTNGGLDSSGLVKNSHGKLVSKRVRELRQVQPHTRFRRFNEAVRQARQELHLVGWVPVGGSTTQGKLLLSTAHRILAENLGEHYR